MAAGTAKHPKAGAFRSIPPSACSKDCSNTNEQAANRRPSRGPAKGPKTICSIAACSVRFELTLVAVVARAGGLAYMVPASEQPDGEAAPMFVDKIPPGYSDWRLISVAHEEGNLNNLGAILGNDLAIKAYREGKLPFPDGTIIAGSALESRPVGGKQQSLWPFPIFRCRATHERSVYGQGLKEIRLHGRLGVRLISTTTANPPTRRCSKPAFPATSLPKLATLSSPVTRLDAKSRTTNLNFALDWYDVGSKTPRTPKGGLHDHSISWAAVRLQVSADCRGDFATGVCGYSHVGLTTEKRNARPEVKSWRMMKPPQVVRPYNLLRARLQLLPGQPASVPIIVASSIRKAMCICSKPCPRGQWHRTAPMPKSPGLSKV